MTLNIWMLSCLGWKSPSGFTINTIETKYLWPTTKFLGLFLTENLSWAEHGDNVMGKLSFVISLRKMVDEAHMSKWFTMRASAIICLGSFFLLDKQFLHQNGFVNAYCVPSCRFLHGAGRKRFFARL
jgi:hypothetical protein